MNPDEAIEKTRFVKKLCTERVEWSLYRILGFEKFYCFGRDFKYKLMSYSHSTSLDGAWREFSREHEGLDRTLEIICGGNDLFFHKSLPTGASTSTLTYHCYSFFSSYKEFLNYRKFLIAENVHDS